ncbi:MAG: 7-carboxy-7-deazaguanine synthase QueE [Gammaproteobacteria bacterium]
MSTTPLKERYKTDVCAKSLRVNEIFLSLQGETSKIGLPTAFIRLTGCPLRCRYCDTEYAFYEGDKISIGGILQTISEYRTRHVTVTGGEPLAQKYCPLLLTRLCDEGYQVSLETNGAMDVSCVDPRVVKILDIKTPGSAEVDKNRFSNLEYLYGHDQIKFVICDRNDYEWSKQILDEYRLGDRCEVLFSNSYDELRAGDLADWILEDKLPVRLQIQLHKVLWGDIPGK